MSHHLTPSFFTGSNRFVSPWSTWTGIKGFAELWDFLRSVKSLPEKGWLSWNRKPSHEDYMKAFPTIPPQLSKYKDRDMDFIRASWVGHSTAYIQLDGFCFLTDPYFSNRASPVSFAGTHRTIPPAFSIEDNEFTELDFVLISHNHYDHLDLDSIKRLHAKFGDELTFYAPLGLKAWFAGVGISNCIELDWWESAVHKSTKLNQSCTITVTPVQHWSKRTIFAENDVLWGGLAVKGPHNNFWFAGDTGYCPVFPEIGDRLGPFDLCLIPIGAYQPRKFLQAQHIDPIEALKIHREVKSKCSIAIHHSSHNATTEALDEPSRLLVEARPEFGVKDKEFVSVHHGSLVEIREGVIQNQPEFYPRADWPVDPNLKIDRAS
eukprot:GDKJ01064605.1.p1 GENE.GDKJ01064605.1~~GDKJ01064605.1.p1  ORF type:complete len:377 (+),score=51.14 GDKJ01064605.1:20-1150(+)